MGINHLLNGLFDALLFIVFLYYLIFIVQRYVISWLHDGILENKKLWSMIMYKKKRVCSQRHDLERQIQQQQKNLCSFEKKMRQWYAALLLRQMQSKKDQEALKKKIEERRLRQAESLNLWALQREVIPQALLQASDELTVLFSGARGEQQLEDLIIKLKK